YLLASVFDDLKKQALSEVENHHRREPLSPGISREALREKIAAHLSPEIFRAVVGELEKEAKIKCEKEIVKAASYSAELSADETVLLERMRNVYEKANFEVPKLNDALSDAVK